VLAHYGIDELTIYKNLFHPGSSIYIRQFLQGKTAHEFKKEAKSSILFAQAVISERYCKWCR
jgi:hypothetical protein